MQREAKVVGWLVHRIEASYRPIGHAAVISS